MTKRARVLQIRRRIAFSVLILFIMLFASIGAFTIKSKAHDNTPDINKYYKSIEVPYGASLYSIAVEYNCNEKSTIQAYMNEVCSINHIEDDTIYAGQYIIIPYYSSDIIL